MFIHRAVKNVYYWWNTTKLWCKWTKGGRTRDKTDLSRKIQQRNSWTTSRLINETKQEQDLWLWLINETYKQEWDLRLQTLRTNQPQQLLNDTEQEQDLRYYKCFRQTRQFPWWKTSQDLWGSLKILKDLLKILKDEDLLKIFEGPLKDPQRSSVAKTTCKDPWGHSEDLVRILERS